MTRPISLRPVLGGLLASFLCLSAANAQNDVSFIKEGGNNTLTCASAASACATLIGGLAKTNAGGAIIMIDSGDFGPGNVDVDQSVSIMGAQTHALLRMTAGTSSGIVIAAGANDVVYIDGLTIEGTNLSNNAGILIVAAAEVHIRNCVIRNITGTPGAGISVASTVNVRVFVENCAFSNNDVGVFVNPTSGAANVTLDNVSIEKNSAAGITADGTGANVLVNASVLTSNFGPAFNAIGAGKIFSFGNNAVGSNAAVGTTIKLNLQ